MIEGNGRHDAGRVGREKRISLDGECGKWKTQDVPGTWQQQDEDGLYSCSYDTSLSDTSQFRFTIPKMDYPLDDRYEVNIVIRDRDKAVRIQTENHLYDTEAP